MAIKDNLQPFWGFNVQGITKDDGSANDAFISSLQSELDKTELDLYSSKLETYLETAEGRWLDYWGRWLGLHRDNRSDDDYRTALINHVLHERNTISAIKEALADFLKVNQDNVYIYEPWRDMFIWNASHYNTHKFFTDPYYRYAVIDIQIEGGYSEVVNEIVNLFRPAGVYWVVTSLVNVLNANAPILDLSLPTNKIIESSDTDYANFTQTNSAYLTSKLDLATYVDDPYHYNKDNLNAGKKYMSSNSSYNPVVFIGSNKEEYNTTIKTNDGGVNLVKDSGQEFSGKAYDFHYYSLASLPALIPGKTYTMSFSARVDDKAVNCEQSLFVDIFNPSWSFFALVDVPISTDYQRVTKTFTVPANITDANHIAAILHSPTINGKEDSSADTSDVAGTGYIKDFMLEEGTVAHAWSPAPSESSYASWLQTNYQNELAITSQQLKQQLVSQNATIKTIDSGVNLIVQSTLSGGYLNRDDGSANGNGSADFHSDSYIATNGATVFTFSSPDYAFKGSQNSVLAMYDSNKNYLGYQSITSPTQTLSKSNVAYIRFSINFVDEGGTVNNLSDWLSNHRYKLEKGSVATDWCPNPLDSSYNSWLQAKYLKELAITQPALISSIDSQTESFTVDQTQTSLLGGIDLLNYLTVYKQAVKPSNQTAKQFILANLATSNTQRLELVLQNQDNLDLTQDVSLELYDYNLHLWIKPVVDYEVHSDYTIFKVSLPSLAPYLSDGGNFMFQVWPTTPNITTLSVNYLGYLFNAPSDIITLANSAETFTMETN